MRGMIKSFRCKDTERLFAGERPRRFRSIQDAAERKLTLLNAAETLEFLRSPPGNRLEALSGDRVGQHSLRLNKRWRLCFVWNDGNAHHVEIVDYH